jgi:hypothetical protein
MITARGTRKISKVIAVGLSISKWSWGISRKVAAHPWNETSQGRATDNGSQLLAGHLM